MGGVTVSKFSGQLHDVPGMVLGTKMGVMGRGQKIGI